MDHRAAREYVNRDWTALESLHLRELAVRFRKGGSAASVLASRRIWERVGNLRRGSASKRARAADLMHHIELKSRLDRAERAFRVR